MQLIKLRTTETSYVAQARHRPGCSNGWKTKRMGPKEIGMLMGGGEGQGDIFTWHEKNRRKV